MAQVALQGSDVQVGVDGVPTNTRFRNMFEEEVILTEKQIMRNALVNERDKMKEKLKTMTPTDIFILFDEDDSGLISFEEFRKMLPFLNINISDAKAYRYFKMCDTDGSGEIDIDEFQVALFACDPTSGNPVGFQPSQHLTPIDAFEMFDEDQTGFLDEDEFRYAIEYLQLPVNDEKLENLFYHHDVNITGMIDYVEFREIFLEVCDLRRELEDRGVDTPTLIRKKTMRKILREILMEEEMKERRALAEAKRYKRWILNIRESKKVIQKAEFRAYQELRGALDAAGHVYVLGAGASGQFAGKPMDKMETKKFKFEHFDKVVDLWRDRVQPQQLIDRLKLERRAQEQDEKRDAERNLGHSALSRNELNRKIVTDPYAEALESPFLGLNINMNTAALWGKRVYQVGVSESVIFALSDTGEIYTWGGNSYWWHEIQPDSVYQTKWRGDTTARSQLLLGIKDKPLPTDASLGVDLDAMTPDDKKAEQIKVVAKYYNCWEPPPVPAQRMIYLEKDILSKIQYDAVKFALTCRGKRIGEMTKMQLVEALYADIILEKKLLGERAHKAIREIEIQIAALQKRKKTKLADQFLKRIDDMWLPLREVQAENLASDMAKETEAEMTAQVKSLNNYQNWRDRITVKRTDMTGNYSPRGNSLEIDLIGATPRGPAVVTPRGYQAAVQISAGNAHACLVHKNGQLYSWGVGNAGRLGLDLTEAGDPQANASKPKLLQALADRPVLRVSCGYSHTGAIVSGGELYMWGSTGNGKCGFGDIVTVEECYCSIPTNVLVGAEDRRVKKLSCGASHTGVITEAGQLYMFGCGDGGRLGLGPGKFATHYVPFLISSLLGERLTSVSCGNTTTIVCTEINHEWVGELEESTRQLAGGRVYVAGSRNVFGTQYDSFTLLRDNIEGVPIKQVSAGYLHSTLVSADGELFCWGHNRSGCCGVSEKLHFLDKPTSVKFLYTRPGNIALGCRAYQSSTYNCREADFAVNGRREGNGVNKCTSTQQESQPWIEIDLGRMAIIERVVIWNRTDVPADRNQPRDLYTSRLFPCWVMIGRDPFPEQANVIGLKEGLRNAVCKAKLTVDKRQSTWICPASSQGRYVRVQLERYNPLSVAEIEVYGYWGFTQGVGRVSHAVAGRDVTVAVIRPSTDPRDIEYLYKRAAYADSLNADILKQLETYTLEYDKYGRGEVLGKQCVICKNLDKCEACMLYQTYGKEIENMPPVIGGRRRRLNSISKYLIESNKPPLEPVVVPVLERPTKWDVRKQAFFDTFNFLNYFKRNKFKNYVTPKEALESSPDQLMTKLKYTAMIDDAKLASMANEVPNFGNNNDSVTGDSQLESAVDETSIAFSGSVGKNTASKRDALALEETSVLKSVRGQQSQQQQYGGVKHGYQSENVKIQVGDTLPTGHLVKEAYPRSIAAQLRESYLAREREEDRTKAALAALDMNESVGSKRKTKHKKKVSLDMAKM